RDWSSDVCSSDLHRKYRLAVKLDLAFGEDRIVLHSARRDVVFARHIGMRQYANDARRRPDGRKVHRPDPAVGDSRKTQTNMEGAGRFRDIVNINGGAGGVLVRGIVTLFGV